MKKSNGLTQKPHAYWIAFTLLQGVAYDIKGEKESQNLHHCLLFKITEKSGLTSYIHQFKSGTNALEVINYFMLNLRTFPEDVTNNWHRYQGHVSVARWVTGPKREPMTIILPNRNHIKQLLMIYHYIRRLDISQSLLEKVLFLQYMEINRVTKLIKMMTIRDVSILSHKWDICILVFHGSGIIT